MLTLEEIKARLTDDSLRLETVAHQTGLAYNTVRRYATGSVTDPPMDSVRRLSDYLESLEEEPAK